MSGVNIESQVAHAAWRDAVPDLTRRANRAARAALAVATPMAAAAAAELALVFVDDAASRTLNRDWRGKDQPTNVLAFAAQETKGGTGGPAAITGGPLLLGDVVLAYETVADEAKAGGVPLGDHASHLIVHGVLHLLGYDHQRPREARVMETLEARALATMGIANPYEALPQEARIMTRAGRVMER
ncbi:MAG: rRNA maturation RNase YbeY [Alphaproteobacteria bacterium]|nr:rRNA maturation RNase YbeY [Alphaproteobacteria bacterium]